MADPEYFTLAEFRELADMDDDAKYPEAKVLAAAAYFTSIVEREVEVPFIPRTYTKTLDGSGTTTVVLPHASIRSLTSVTLDGAVVSTALLTAEAGVLRYLAGGTWPRGVSNLVVVYSAGAYTTCPADIKDAAMAATRDRLITQAQESGSWDRRSSETSNFGTVNYVLPGEKRPTGYPDLDAVIASYTRHVSSFGFA